MKKYMKVCIVIALAFALLGCSKPKPTDPDPTPAPTAVPTAIPNVSLTVNFAKRDSVNPLQPKDTSVIVIASYSDGYTIKNIQDATVTINGTNIPFIPYPGSYSLDWDSSITTGSTVTLNVTSTHGNFSASGVLPAAGGLQVQVAIPGCLLGSMYLDHFK